LIVGAYGAKSGAGKSYVIFGKQDNTATYDLPAFFSPLGLA
jgi:hypothetical protein